MKARIQLSENLDSACEMKQLRRAYVLRAILELQKDLTNSTQKITILLLCPAPVLLRELTSYKTSAAVTIWLKRPRAEIDIIKFDNSDNTMETKTDKISWKTPNVSVIGNSKPILTAPLSVLNVQGLRRRLA